MPTWPVLVTIHSVTRVPKEVSTLTKPGLRFRVCVTASGADAVASSQLSSACPEVSSTFEPRDVQSVQADQYEVKLDGTSGSGRGSLEWASPAATVSVLVSIKEEEPSSSSRTIAAAAAVSVNLEDIIERRKLRTLLIGTSMGQVGISIAVAPSDTAGYRRRLELFLGKYNPEGLRLVASVVSSVSELDTFTKVNKKYKIVDYQKRVRKFFATYGPDYIEQCDSILQQWENREEELMRNLVLDNGPELSDVDPKARIEAFGRRYSIPPSDWNVAELVRLHSANMEPFFDEMCVKYGPEPDPRGYLFGKTYYGERSQPSTSNSSSQKRPPTSRPGPSPNRSELHPSPPPPPNASEIDNDFGTYYQSTTFDAATPASASASQPPSYVANPNPLPPQQQQQQPQRGVTFAPASSSTRREPLQETPLPYASRPSQPSSSAGLSTPPPLTTPASSTSAAPLQRQELAAPSSSIEELWSRLVEDLRSDSVPAAELHYLSEGAFMSLLSELGYSASTKQLLATEWRRRMTASLRMEQLAHGDSLFEAAKRDVITISGLHPLNVTVVGVTHLKNSVHESSFSLRLGEAKLRTTERLLMIGEHHKLLGYATNGVSQNPNLESTLPAAVFHRKPFFNITRPSSLSVAVCDVVIGKPFVGASPQSDPMSALTAPREGSIEFLSEFDSCVFFDPTAGQSVAVYQPQQVLVKYLVQCNVDTSLTPCPAHPSKAVEFFVVENNTFACSQCVVMGQHRGKEVVTVEDATLQARTQLQDVQRDVLHLASEMAAVEADCERLLQNIQHSEFRINATRQIEIIRREAEQKITAIQAELEAYERHRKDTTTDSKQQARRVMEDAQKLATQLDDGLRTRGASETIALLLNTKRSGVMESLRDRASTVRQSAAGNTMGGSAGTAAAAGAGGEPHYAFNSSNLNSVSAAAPLAAPVAAPAPILAQLQQLSTTPSATGIRMSRQVPNAFPSPAPTASVVPFSAPSESPLPNGVGASAVAARSSSQANGSGAADASSLYNRFLSLKQQQQQQSMPAAATGLSQLSSSSFATADQSIAARAAARATADYETKRMKDLITAGWAEFRKGDRVSAQRIWQDVYERNANNAIGARAKAYISEAIDKNYTSAAEWYEKALSIDPQDGLTLYNYGVLLESVLNRKEDALQLFETAHRLGDQTAGKRAAQLRRSMK